MLWKSYLSYWELFALCEEKILAAASVGTQLLVILCLNMYRFLGLEFLKFVFVFFTFYSSVLTSKTPVFLLRESRYLILPSSAFYFLSNQPENI